MATVDRVSFPLTYTTAGGFPLADGYLLLRLSQDGSVNDSQITSADCKVLLDSTGTPVGLTLWPNAAITPSGTYYIISSYTASGELVSGPTKYIATA